MTTPFSPESTPPAASEPQPLGGQPEGGQAPPEGQAAPQGADPRVLEQMQQQMQEFGGTVSQMAEYLPAIQQIAEQQQGPGQPSIEDQFGQFFGDPGYGDPYAGDPGYGQGQPQFDPYTGEPVQPQPRFDPQTGRPLQPQGQPQGQPGLQGDPNQFVDLMREVVRQELAPQQQAEQQRQWNGLYEEFPQMRDEQMAPQIAEDIAQAAWMFASGRDQQQRAKDAERLANDPRFVRRIYLSSVNGNAAQGETPAGASDGTNAIESPGGASTPGQPEVDEGEAIVSAGRGGSGAAGSYFR